MPKKSRKPPLHQVTDEDIAAWLAQEDARTEEQSEDEFIRHCEGGEMVQTSRWVATMPAAPRDDHVPLARGFGANIDRRTGTRWRKASLGFDVTIDLHGFTQDEAFDYLKSTIERAYHAQTRRVLVITGKGLLGGGILRRAVEGWVAKGPLRPYVVGYDHAPQSYGGTGAWMVYLKRKKKHEPV